MLSRQRWALRLFGIVGAASSAAALQGGCIGQSSCPEGEDIPWQTTCYAKSDLAGAAGAGGAADNDECPTTTEIQQTELQAATVDSVTDNGDTCCYRYFYPCEGRPLLHEDQVVLAPSTRRRDWCDEIPAAALLDLDTRRALADAWARDAAFEHASIASFSRFILDLLALGAPHDLVSEAQRALADEVRHARLCYELASRYAGEAIGPGRLAVPPFAPRSLREAALEAAREGCVAETIAAFTVSERLARARDREVVRTLRRIVADEQRHAELAWRFVRWALEQDRSLGREIAEIFRRAELELSGVPVPRSGASNQLAAHGQLSESERRLLAYAAMSELVAPLGRAVSRLN